MSEVKHNLQDFRFELDCSGEMALLEYRLLENKAMEIYRTFVPDSGRGQGVAGKLAKSALSYAGENQLKVLPACSYIAKYIERNPEYKDLL